MSGKSQGERRIGLLNGFAAYGMWGLVPLFWPLLKPAGAVEILAHRMAWSLVFVAVALVFVRRWAWAGELIRQPRRLALVTVAAAVITVNWGVYIWSVNTGHVVEASLGYFINPLVTIAMGVLLLKERLRPVQWAAVGIGFAAVIVLTVGYGRPPWISSPSPSPSPRTGWSRRRSTSAASSRWPRRPRSSSCPPSDIWCG